MNRTFQFWPGSLELEQKPAHLLFAKRLEKKFADCHGYLAYKLTNLGRASEDETPSFLLITQEHGVVAIDLLEEGLEKILPQEEQEFWLLDNGDNILSRSLLLQIFEEEIKSRLKNNLRLYDKKQRKVKIPVKSVIVFCKNDRTSLSKMHELKDYDINTLCLDDLDEFLDQVKAPIALCLEELDSVISLLEGTFIYQPATTYKEEKDPETYDDYIQLSLKTTFKQDDSQRAVSMQLPNGPQRIRGLAGTGKTIVLSLKAAITHKKLPKFKILYLFNTQSLYSQIQTLISKYYTTETKKSPDFDSALQVLHAWGGRTRKGLYSELCRMYGLHPLNFSEVRGGNDPLKLIYSDLLKNAGDRLEEIFDLVLIDEAQDLPEEIFEVVFRITKTIDGKKRIVWAYDEFQSLKESQVKNPSELFGKKSNGLPNLPNEELEGEYAGGIEKDFILPNCYRTPRPVLMIAHGIALGLYGQITQMFYRKKDWEAIGYSVVSPSTLDLKPGDNVKLERKEEFSKNILEQLISRYKGNPLDLVQFHSFASWSEEIGHVAQTIRLLIDKGNVKPEEIVIVNLLSGNNKSSMLSIQRELTNHSISSVIPGYVESADIFKPSGNVTISTPFRAKGNEANIVFVVNAQIVPNDFTLRGRNTFFVAATRSRGWCFISGNGAGIKRLEEEISAIKKDFPYFNFVCPTEDKVRSSRYLLGKSDRELDEIQKALKLIMNSEELKGIVLSALKEKDE